MEIQYAIPLGIFLLAAILIVVVIRFSAKGNASNNLANLAIVCLILSVMALGYSAWRSGNWQDLLKLSAPLTIMFIVLAVKKRKQKRVEK